MKKGDVVELIEDTAFYRKGQRAVVVKKCEGNQDIEIRYEGEKYCGNDVDIMPEKMLRHV